MAYNDLAQFLPQAGGFKTPGQYDRMLKAEAVKKASYLSAMDQFYSQLEETMREFNLNLGQQKKEFSNLLDLRRDYRNLEYGKLGLEALGLGVNAFLKNKDITYGLDWASDVFTKFFRDQGVNWSAPNLDLSGNLGDFGNFGNLDLGDYGFGSSNDYNFGTNLDFDLPEFNF